MGLGVTVHISVSIKRDQSVECNVLPKEHRVLEHGPWVLFFFANAIFDINVVCGHFFASL